MPVSLDVMLGPRLKVERANRHIDELRTVTQPLSRELYRLEVENGFAEGSMILAKPQRNSYELRYKPIKPVSKTLALIVGDVVHNLRGALDHLATGIRSSIAWDAQGHFPMRQSREELISQAGVPIPDLDAIEAALPGSIHLLLDEIRPANGRNEKFWSFHTLDNDDKHNLIIPTVTVTDIVCERLLVGTNTINLAMIRSNADEPSPALVHTTGIPIIVDGNIDTTVDIKFADVGPFKNDPVIPTLVQLSQVVSDTLDAFERLIKSAP